MAEGPAGAGETPEVIKLRLWGQRHELAEALPVIRDAFNVLSESELVKDRGQSQYYRLYLEVEVRPRESTPDLHEMEVKALELLAIWPEPVGGEFDPAFLRLAGLGLAHRTERGWEITESGCEYLARHVPGSTVPNSKAPCGFTRLY